MDSEPSPQIRANLKFSYLIPPLSHFKFVRVVCYLPLCSGTHIRCCSDPLSSTLKDRHRHLLTNSPNWAAALSPGPPVVPALERHSSVQPLDFEMSCLSSHRSALTSCVYPDSVRRREDPYFPSLSQLIQRDFFSSVCQLYLQSFSLSSFSCFLVAAENSY